MKLLELYSCATGLKVKKQFLHEAFYPLPFDRYICIVNGSGMTSKNYSFYNEVLSIMGPALKAANIEVVQLGGKDDPALNGCHHTQGQTSIHQSSFLLRKALCLITNDSWLSHRAGELGVPLVACYGPTSIENHSPYVFDPQKALLIESHRNGKRPSFAAQEPARTIDLIPPEKIANAALLLLGLPQVARKTLYVGEVFNQHLVELVPNVIVDPKISIVGAMVIRMDLHHDESIMMSNLQLRKCAIAINKEVNLNILAQLKGNIASLRIQVDELSPEWLRQVKKLGVPTAYVSHEQDPEKLAALRLKLYDACLFDHYMPRTKEDFFKESKAYLNKELDAGLNFGTLQFKVNRMILSDGKVYLSNAHRLAGKNTPSSEQNTGQVIDDPEFWNDLGSYLIYQ